MNSYQKRKRETKYYKQRGEELEQIIVEMYKYMKQQGIKPLIPLTPQPVTGRMFINDLSTGGLQQHLINIAENMYGYLYNEEQLEKLKKGD